MSIEVNHRLVEIFGLQGQRVRELTLRATAGEAPTITITRLLIDAGEVHATTRQFDLVLTEPDDPCKAALARLQVFIEEAGAAASAKLRRDHERALDRLLRAPTLHAHLHDFYPLPRA